jgi:hypothetical protein
VIFLRFHVLYLFGVIRYPYTAQVRPGVHSQPKPSHTEASVLCKALRTVRTIDTLSTANAAWTVLKMIPGLHGERSSNTGGMAGPAPRPITL